MLASATMILIGITARIYPSLARQKLLPIPDIAKRLEETVSFRGMLFYLSSVFYLLLEDSNE